MKKGFTLVELSIVLVIIGLLIGGILVGETLIESSKLTAQINQISQSDAAAGAFKSKYKNLPGDAKVFGGDADGRIEGLNANTSYEGAMNAYSGEISSFWAQAFPGQYKSGTYTIGTGGAADYIIVDGANKSAPKSKYGKKNSALYVSGVGYSGATWRGNFYSIATVDYQQLNGGWVRIGSSNEGNVTLKPTELLSLDSKLDDGIPNTGNVIAGNFSDDNYGFLSLNPLANCSSGANYLVSNDTYQCTPAIRMGI